ncbi:MAG: AMP-binding protein [Enterobacterales bacterium]|nr:AMP-binding protein [Enterobacterales bacterium]
MMNDVLPLSALKHNFKHLAVKLAFYQPDGARQRVWTWEEVEKAVRSLIGGLHDLGLGKGDAVAIYGKNSAEWIIADWAVMLAGMVSIPIYPTANEETLAFIIERTKCKAVFSGKVDDYQIGQRVFSSSLAQIALPCDSIDGPIAWKDWMAQKSFTGEFFKGAADSVISIMYTSGSTGTPKGVELTQSAYASACGDTARWLNVNQSDRLFSYLPLAHIAERVVTEGMMIYAPGAVTYFSESLETFIDDLKAAKPTVFFSVPRLWAKFLASIYHTVPKKKLSSLLNDPSVNQSIKRKIKCSLGFEETRVWVSAAAPIAREIIEEFEALDIYISEAWGMTEVTGAGCINYPFKSSMIGTIGKPFTDAQVRLSQDNEIQVKGRNVFERYHLSPEVTAESFTDDGWFKTKDRGEWDEQGALKIVGRLKDEFKTTTGKYIIPSPIEAVMCNHDIIELACVMGSNRPQPFAAVVLSDTASLLDKDAIRRELERFLQNTNESLENHQKLSHILVASEPWTIENNMLTPTMKIRRFEIEARFKEAASALNNQQKVLWCE